MVKSKETSQTSSPAGLKKIQTGITGLDQITNGGAGCSKMRLE